MSDIKQLFTIDPREPFEDDMAGGEEDVCKVCEHPFSLHVEFEGEEVCIGGDLTNPCDCAEFKCS